MIRCRVVAVMMLVSAPASAQPDPAATPPGSAVTPAKPPPDPGVFYDDLAIRELEQLHQGPWKPDPKAKKSEIEKSNAQFRNIAVETPAVDPASGFTAAERAAAVVSTSIEGAKAGVNIAPFALARPDLLRGLSFTVAAFDDGVTRFGAGYLYEYRPTPSFLDLGIACKIDDEATKLLLADTREGYVTTCTQIVPAITPAMVKCDSEEKPEEVTKCQIRVNTGMAACGLPAVFPGAKGGPPLTVTAAKASLVGLVERARTKGTFAIPIPLRGAYDVLKAYRLPRPLDCVTSKKIDIAVMQWAWAHPTHKVSGGGFVDMFSLTLGHNPEMLEDFETKGVRRVSIMSTRPRASR
jgi:hypothetical protein